MRSRLASVVGAGALVAAAGFSGLGCGVSDEIVADKTLPESGTQDGAQIRTCGEAGPCAPGEFCNKTSCDPAAEGTCMALPDATSCSDQTYSPVCGCDGTQYWNDCVRLQHGVTTTQPCAAPSFKECDTQGKTPALPARRVLRIDLAGVHAT